MHALGPYQVLGELGRGASGLVLRGRDPAGRAVALKLLTSPSDPRRVERLRREGLLAGRLSHPGIAAVHDLVTLQDGRLLLVSELVEGRTLDEASRGLDRAARVELVRQTAAAMAHAHAQGVVHRDLKPHNVLVGDATGAVKVIDFGLARAEDVEPLTRTGAIVGTPSHMSPEQLLGQPAGAPADVWALGVLLHEALVGRPPFQATAFLELLGQVTGEPVPPLRAHDPEVPPALEAVALRALARAPADRFADAGQLLAALEEALARPEAVRSTGHGLRLVAIVGGLALGAAAVAGVAASRGDPPPAPPPASTAPAAGPTDAAGWLAEATALAAPRPGRTACEAAADPAAAKDAQGAVAALARAAALGSLEATRRLARAEDEGWGCAADAAAAARDAQRAAEGGDGPAMAHLARLLDLGRGVPLDRERARTWRRQALAALRARLDDPACRVALGRLLTCDGPIRGELGEEVEEPAALFAEGLALLRAARDGADAEGLAALGVALRRAPDGTPQADEAPALLEAASGMWSGRVAAELARCFPAEPASAVRWLERALALGDRGLGDAERAELRCELGERLVEARDLGRGPEGRAQLAALARAGHARAALTLARACRDGLGGPSQLPEALRWAATAAGSQRFDDVQAAEAFALALDGPEARAALDAQGASGSPAAVHLLGALLERGRSDPGAPRARRLEAAAAAYRRAIAGGFAPARWAMGLMLFGAAPAEAVAFLSPLAAAGDPRALRLVAISQATGRGAPKDDAAAVATFREARRAGDELGALLLARMLHEGRGAPRDDAAALALIAWARPGLEAKPGSAGHLRYLARLGAEISGDRGDVEGQLRWLRLGVTHGDPAAMRALGQRLVDGDGARRDVEAGRALLRRAEATRDPKDPDPLRAPREPGEGR